jgi:hypothetical protein
LDIVQYPSEQKIDVALLVKYVQLNENNMKVNHSLHSCLDFVIDIIYLSLFSPCFPPEKKGKLLMVWQRSL